MANARWDISPNLSTRQLVEQLRHNMRHLQQHHWHSEGEIVSSGCRPLDRLLPQRGFRRGTLIEWLSAGEGTGAETLAMLAGREACRQGGAFVVLDPPDTPPTNQRSFCCGKSQATVCHSERSEESAIFQEASQALRFAQGDRIAFPQQNQHSPPEQRRSPGTRPQFYPPAAARLGIDLERLIVVRADNQPDLLWALDQALRCPGVAAALAPLQRLDGHTFRRLQLAAEEGGSLGLLLRWSRARSEPSWADVRLWVEPLPAASPATDRRLKLQLLRCRGESPGNTLEIVTDDETHSVHLVPPLVTATRASRAAEAS